MYKFQQKDMSGTLFLNDRKIAEKQPDYTGKAVIQGKTVQISAWVKTAKNGNKYLSLSFQFQDDKPKTKKPQQLQQTFEDNRVTFDEGFGEPQSEFNKKVDDFGEQIRQSDIEDTEDVPF